MGYSIDKNSAISNMLFVAMWLVGAIPFFGQEFVYGLYVKISSVVLLIADIIIVSLGVITIKHKTDKILLCLFVAASFYSTCFLNGGTLLQYVNGMRLYLGFIFLIPIFRYFIENDQRRDAFISKMDKNLYFFLWLQLPCSIIQCMRYGAFDQVGGSLGWMLSGEMSTLVYLISLYFMRKKWDKTLGYLANIRKNWTLILLLLPSFLNETKVSFIYLLLYFFFVMPMDKKLIVRVLCLAPCVAIILFVMSTFYSMMAGGKSGTFSGEYIETYLYGDEDGRNYVEFVIENGSDIVEEDQGDLARFIKFMAVPMLWEEKDHTTLWGYGIGQFKGGSVLEKTELAKEYEWLLHGTVMTFYMFALELGILGLAWFIVFWIMQIRSKDKANRDTPIMIYLMILVAIIGLYNASFNNLAFSIIFMYIFCAPIIIKEVNTKS